MFATDVTCRIFQSASRIRPLVLYYHCQKLLAFCSTNTTIQKIWISVILFFKEINTFIQQGHLKLVESSNKYIYNVTKQCIFFKIFSENTLTMYDWPYRASDCSIHCPKTHSQWPQVILIVKRWMIFEMPLRHNFLAFLRILCFRLLCQEWRWTGASESLGIAHLADKLCQD